MSDYSIILYQDNRNDRTLTQRCATREDHDQFIYDLTALESVLLSYVELEGLRWYDL